jgi:hypothetical protein
MKKDSKFTLIIQMSFGQTNLSWRGYFSYNEIKDMSSLIRRNFSGFRKRLIFFKNSINQIKTTNTVDGLQAKL